MSVSPRFSERKSKVENIITAASLKQAWGKHVRHANRLQVVSDLTDYFDIHLNLDLHINAVIAKVLSGTYVPSPPLSV